VAERAKAKRTEADLKAAARRLLTQTGYAEIRITDIAAEAGKAVGSFYRYFEDKDDLLRSLADDFKETLRSRVVQQVGHEHTMVTAANVRHHVQAFWDTYREHLPEMVGLFQASMLNEDFRRLHGELRDRQVRTWARHLRETPLAASRTSGQARTLALAVVCMLEYFCYTRLAEQSGPVREGEVVELLSELLAGGLLGTTPSH
jgi:AcrR family transcriptional regulator